MSIINITVEGQSEQKFCKDLLNEYVYRYSGHQLYARPVTTNFKKGIKGGAVKYAKLKYHIETWMKETPGQFHTTFFDLYALPNSYPGNDANNTLSGELLAKHIENEMMKDIDSRLFLPYIQVHEFEALLYSDPAVLHTCLSVYTTIPDDQFHQHRAPYASPEEINNSQETAPSKRILGVYKGYNKITDGYLIAKEIGIDKMREVCPHFNEWVTRLIGLEGV